LYSVPKKTETQAENPQNTDYKNAKKNIFFVYDYFYFTLFL